ncbi:MAG TPA: hypothetical protein VFH27_15935, partial [Longimicrobiaceae bacterium]|nr:hypothetical protein [Longimicrobiaceae bacterium]
LRVVTFVVVDSASSEPIAGAAVSLPGIRGSARTDSLGRHVMRGGGVAVGRARVARVGYFPRDVRWNPAGDSAEVRVQLVSDRITLAEISVVAERLDEVISSTGNAVRTIGSAAISASRSRDALELIQDQTSLRPLRCRGPDASVAIGRTCYTARGRTTRACVIIDETPALAGLEDLTGVVTGDVGRIYVGHGGSVVAVYTRGFLKEAASRGRSLRNLDMLSSAFCARS